MKQYFLSPRQQLESRWRQAFTDAILVADSASIIAAGVAWIDADGLPAIELGRRIQACSAAGCKVVVMSPVLNDQEGLAAVQAGATGYVHVLAHPKQLREVARVVEMGGLWLGAELLRLVAAAATGIARQVQELSAVEPSLADRSLAQLTPKEAQAAQLVAQGASNREIARVLSVSERTVKAHLTACFEKLRVRDRVQLALLLNNIEVSFSPADF